MGSYCGRFTMGVYCWRFSANDLIGYGKFTVGGYYGNFTAGGLTWEFTMGGLLWNFVAGGLMPMNLLAVVGSINKSNAMPMMPLDVAGSINQPKSYWACGRFPAGGYYGRFTMGGLPWKVNCRLLQVYHGVYHGRLTMGGYCGRFTMEG